MSVNVHKDRINAGFLIGSKNFRTMMGWRIPLESVFNVSETKQRHGRGHGFMIAPRIMVTCSHVIKEGQVFLRDSRGNMALIPEENIFRSPDERLDMAFIVLPEHVDAEINTSTERMRTGSEVLKPYRKRGAWSCFIYRSYVQGMAKKSYITDTVSLETEGEKEALKETHFLVRIPGMLSVSGESGSPVFNSALEISGMIVAASVPEYAGHPVTYIYDLETLLHYMKYIVPRDLLPAGYLDTDDEATRPLF